MKVAIATEANNVAEHFGHCEGFTIFEIEGSTVKSRQFVKNPGHQPGVLPNYLNELAVKAIISGGMGSGAVRIFDEKGIKVITGARGSIDDNIRRYIDGQLKSTGSVCHEHQHSDSCGGH